MEKIKAYSLLFFIGSPKITENAREWMETYKLPVHYQTTAKGTASGEWRDLFGLTGVDKVMMISFLSKQASRKMVNILWEKLYLGSPNTGIAFTVPMSGGNSGLLNLAGLHQIPIEEGKEREDSAVEGNYSMILAFVDQGFSEEVMKAGKSVGASGGTVFHARRVGSQEALQYWGISIQEEREIVLILTKKEKKMDIMKAIASQCGAETEAHGVVVSLPVDHVAGLPG